MSLPAEVASAVMDEAGRENEGRRANQGEEETVLITRCSIDVLARGFP